ncbi:MAG: hypothetical protein LCI03_03440 [Actinobacteria bacterium]|nr:hypothetical protein [Actinomycetota bacterium]
MPTTTWLPRGAGLTRPEFKRRHRVVGWFLLGTLLAALVAQTLHGWGSVSWMTLAGLGLAAALGAGSLVGPRRWQALARSSALILAVGAFIQAGGGLPDLFFAYFVALVVVSLYQDLVVLVVVSALLLGHHALLTWVVTDAALVDAESEPLGFFLVEVVFVVAMGAVLTLYWRFLYDSEQAQARQREQYVRLEALRAEADVAAARAKDELARRLELSQQLSSSLSEITAVGRRVTDDSLHALRGLRQSLARAERETQRADELSSAALGRSSGVVATADELRSGLPEAVEVSRSLRGLTGEMQALALYAGVEAARNPYGNDGLSKLARDLEQLAEATAAVVGRVDGLITGMSGGLTDVADAFGRMTSDMRATAGITREVHRIVHEQAAAVAGTITTLEGTTRQVAGAVSLGARAVSTTEINVKPRIMA